MHEKWDLKSCPSVDHRHVFRERGRRPTCADIAGAGLSALVEENGATVNGSSHKYYFLSH